MVRSERFELATFWSVAMNVREISGLVLGTTTAHDSQSLLVANGLSLPRTVALATVNNASMQGWAQDWAHS